MGKYGLKIPKMAIGKVCNFGSKRTSRHLCKKVFSISLAYGNVGKGRADLQITCPRQKCKVWRTCSCHSTEVPRPSRVFRRRLINHLALVNCTKRHKKLSNLIFFLLVCLIEMSINYHNSSCWPQSETIWGVLYCVQYSTVVSCMEISQQFGNWWDIWISFWKLMKNGGNFELGYIFKNLEWAV